MAMKLALVGIGKIAQDQHIPALQASSEWELAATVSRNGAVEGVESFNDFSKMLANRPDIKVVSLCLPPVPRFAYAAEALRANRHVMLEKPPGATLSECRILETMARAHGTSIYATWHSREAASVAAAKAWLADKALKRVSVIWKEDVRRWHPGQTWIWQAGGLGVFDPGINALSIVTAILPEPIHLSSADLYVPENCQTPIAANLAFNHPQGAAVTAEFDFRQQGQQTWSIEIDTDQGNLTLTDGGANMFIDGAPFVQPSDSTTLTGEYPRLYANMAALVRDGGVDMDMSPMLHVADAYMLGNRHTVEAFIE